MTTIPNTADWDGEIPPAFRTAVLACLVPHGLRAYDATDTYFELSLPNHPEHHVTFGWHQPSEAFHYGVHEIEWDGRMANPIHLDTEVTPPAVAAAIAKVVATATPGTAFRSMASRFFAGVDAAREAELAADDERQAQNRRDFLGGAL